MLKSRKFYRLNRIFTDTDGDGLNDYYEIHVSHTNPYLADSDGDGISDLQEILNGTNPNKADSDGDLVNDAEDADPKDPLVNWHPTPEASYALIDVNVPSGNEYSPRDLNNKGEVLFDNGIWAAGDWIPLDDVPDVDGSCTYGGEEAAFTSNSVGWQSFNDNRKLLGWSKIKFNTGHAAGGDPFDSARSKDGIQSPSDLGQAILMFDKYAPSVGPLGVAEDGTQFISYDYRVETTPNKWEMKRKIVVFSPLDGTQTIMTGPDGTNTHAYYSNFSVSGAGWSVANSGGTDGLAAANYRLCVWNPQHGLVTLPNEANGYFYPLHLNDMPNNKPLLVAGSSEGGTVILPDRDGTMVRDEYLSGKNIQTFAGDGTAMTNDHKLWRNGKLIPLRDLCSRFGELLDSGYQFYPLKSNKHGMYLIQAENPQGATGTKLAVPVEIIGENQKYIKELKVAKMMQTGVINHDYTLLPNNDRDCFSIRVRGGASLGQISVKVSTENPDPSYNDDPTQIDLHVDGHDAVSDTMILVSDDEDDVHKIDNIADNATNDRSHKIQLGGNFIVDSIKVGNNSWTAMELKAPVRVVKTVDINAVIFRDKALAAGGVPVVLQATVDKYLQIVKERYAQVGVKINVLSVVIQDPPIGINMENGYKLAETSREEFVSNDTKMLITQKGTVGSGDIHIFFVKDIIFGAGSPKAGFALCHDSINASDEDYTYNAFVSADRVKSSIQLGGIVTAHELGHLLRGADHASMDGYVPQIQLMTANVIEVDEILSSKRLSKTDEAKIQGNSHAK